ncbi:MAG: IS30 family transposase, partial [Cocleimonas sp.]
WERIECYLRRELSPEQISIRLKYKKEWSISPEWIYQYIDEDKPLLFRRAWVK